MVNIESFILSSERFLASFWDLLVSSSIFFRVAVFLPFLCILFILLYSYFSKKKMIIFTLGQNVMAKKVPFTNLLLADDDPHVIKFFSFLLEKRGVEVTIATNGEQALNIWRENPSFDLVIADINMPKMNGVDLGAYIYKHCPVVLMSADEEKVLQKKDMFTNHKKCPTIKKFFKKIYVFYQP